MRTDREIAEGLWNAGVPEEEKVGGEIMWNERWKEKVQYIKLLIAEAEATAFLEAAHMVSQGPVRLSHVGTDLQAMAERMRARAAERCADVRVQ